MQHVDFEFAFQSVGQGLFYTGKIGGFNFVYDCGSSSKGKYLTSAIDNYKKSLNNKTLDLLVISHFDKDHTSGLDQLLSGVNVKTVAMPYLTPEERLLVAVRTPKLEKWQYEFLSDPLSYLLEQGVKEILVVGGGAPNREEEEGFPPNEENERIYRSEDFNEELNVDFTRMKEDEDLKKKICEMESLNEGIPDNVHATNHRSIAYLSKLWMFKFFNCPIEEGEMKNFRNCVKSARINLKDIRDAVKDAGKRDELRNCYRKICGTAMNDTSLLLYHGPVCCSKRYHGVFFEQRYEETKYHAHCHCCFPMCDCDDCYRCGRMWRGCCRGGHLMMGDVNLANNWDGISNHYTQYLPSVWLCQVPHHGSKHGWDKKLLDEVHRPALMVVSAGKKNRYRHPHVKVLKDIRKAGHIVVQSNETHKLVFTGKIHIHCP